MSDAVVRFELPRADTQEAIDVVLAFARQHNIDPNEVAALVGKVGRLVVPREDSVEQSRRQTGRAISEGSLVRNFHDSLEVQGRVAEVRTRFEGVKALARIVNEGLVAIERGVEQHAAQAPFEDSPPVVDPILQPIEGLQTVAPEHHPVDAA